MIQKVSVPVSVELSCDHLTRRVFPRWVVWGNRAYKIKKVGLHHFYYRGKVLIHVFSVSTDSMFFRLSFDSQSLSWHLEEVSDGLPD